MIRECNTLYLDSLEPMMPALPASPASAAARETTAARKTSPAGEAPAAPVEAPTPASTHLWPAVLPPDAKHAVNTKHQASPRQRLRMGYRARRGVRDTLLHRVRFGQHIPLRSRTRQWTLVCEQAGGSHHH